MAYPRTINRSCLCAQSCPQPEPTTFNSQNGLTRHLNHSQQTPTQWKTSSGLHKLVNEGDVLVSYDVTALFTNIPVDEAIQILANKAFENNWFNDTYDLQLKKADLVELLDISVKNQLFQFDGKLYEQIDGVTMGSPIGPLPANAFMCSLEEQLQEEGIINSIFLRALRR